MLGGVVWGLSCWSLCQENTFSSAIRVSTSGKRSRQSLQPKAGTLLLPADSSHRDWPLFPSDCASSNWQTAAILKYPTIQPHSCFHLSRSRVSGQRVWPVLVVRSWYDLAPQSGNASRHEQMLTKTSGKFSKPQEAVYRGQVRRRRARSVSKSSKRYYCNSKRRACSTVAKFYTNSSTTQSFS